MPLFNRLCYFVVDTWTVYFLCESFEIHVFFVVTAAPISACPQSADSLGHKQIWREGLWESKMAASLFEEREIEPWRESFQFYDKILKVKADKEKKDKAKKLMELDHW